MTITPPTIKAREVLCGETASFDQETGVGRIRYTPGESLVNPLGAVLGGYLAAMLDDVSGLATWYSCGNRPFATAQMSTSFLRAAKSGDALIGEASLVGSGKRQAFVDATLTREVDGKVIARATVLQTFLS